MKDVFLIGDSITKGYAPALDRISGDSVVIWRTSSDMSNYQVENARWTGYTLNNLARHMWLKGIPKRFDVVHWNNGIWDTVIRHPEDGCFTPPEQYRENLIKIARELKKLSDHVIFATTIPPRTDLFLDVKNGFDFIDRRHEDTIAYNEIAKEVLPTMGVEIEDMYHFVLPNRETYLREDDNTHLTTEGEEACAQFVWENLKRVLDACR